MTAEPERAASLVKAPPRPFDVEYGDRLVIGVDARMALTPQYVLIEWHFTDDARKLSTETRRKL